MNNILFSYLQAGVTYLGIILFLIIALLITSKYHDRRAALLWSIIVFLIITALATYTRLHLVPFNADESRRAFLLTGDEPAYLMTALSIAHDGDINLANNAENKDYLRFQQRRYTGSDFKFYNSLSKNRLADQKEEWGDSRYMRHRPGTSLLLSPAFLIADHNHRFWAYTIMTFCFAIFCGLIIYYMSQVQGTPLSVILTTCLICGLSPPVFFYANQAYPEIPAGILLALTGMLFLRSDHLWILPFILAATVIWFSDRAILAALILCAGGIYCLPSMKKRIIAAIILGSSGLLFAFYCMHRFGVPYPLSHNTVMGFSFEKIPIRLLQIFFDAHRGWFWLFPPVLLLPAILWHILRNNRTSVPHITITISFLVIIVLVAAFDDWAGGTCPSGRYYVVPQFLFILLAVLWLREPNGRKFRIIWMVGLGALGIMQLFWLTSNPRWWYRAYHPMFGWKDIQPLYTYLPILSDKAGKQEWLELARMAPLLLLPSLSCIVADWRQKNKSTSFTSGLS